MAGQALQWTLSSGSSRVLDCAAALARAQKLDPAAASPFQLRVFNQAILIKDTPPIGTVFPGLKLGTQRPVCTKVFLPFDARDPQAGGRMTIYGTNPFRAAVAELVELKAQDRAEAFAADNRVLAIFDRLPTLAPFLLRDRFELEKIPVGAGYFDVPEEEWESIGRFIRSQFQQIFACIFPDQSDAAKAKLDRLLTVLWDLSDRGALEELADAFRIDRESCADSFYAWKGVLYFQHDHTKHKLNVQGMLGWLGALRSYDEAPGPRERQGVEAVAGHLETFTVQTMRDIDRRFAVYQKAFNDLFGGGGDPRGFVQFLRQANEHFQELGIGIAKLQHLAEIWDRTTRPAPNRRPPVQVLTPLLRTMADLSLQSIPG